jgi:hypothetical protein
MVKAVHEYPVIITATRARISLIMGTSATVAFMYLLVALLNTITLKPVTTVLPIQATMLLGTTSNYNNPQNL